MTKLTAWVRSTGWALAALACMALTPAPAAAQAPAKVTIVVFGFPSLGAFMPPVIKAKKLDEANGLDITFEERPPDAYTTQFNSGEFKVGGSAALLTVGLADERGVKVKYLFNLFDFWGAVVTSRAERQDRSRISKARSSPAARATTNFQMFEFFAKKLGVDISKIKVVNTAPPGLVGYALADRADAVQLWEPAYTLLKAKKPDIRMLDLSHGQDLEELRRRRAASPISASPRTPTGSSRIRRWCRSSTPPTRRPANRSSSTRRKPRS